MQRPMTQRWALLFEAFGLDSDCAITRSKYRDKWLPAFVGTVQDCFIELLRDVPAVTITTDGWTDVELRKYVVMTHWLNNNFVQRHATLELSEFHGGATGEALFDHIKENVHAIVPADTFVLVSVSDGAGNAINASSYLAGDGALWCGTHLLQLVARSLLDQQPFAQLTFMTFMPTLALCARAQSAAPRFDNAKLKLFPIWPPEGRLYFSRTRATSLASRSSATTRCSAITTRRAALAMKLAHHHHHRHHRRRQVLHRFKLMKKKPLTLDRVVVASSFNCSRMERRGGIQR
jgi:hypothetical protein